MTLARGIGGALVSFVMLVASASAQAATLLGARRADVERAHATTGADRGWTLYGDGLAITYDHDVATRVRLRTTARTCEEAAREAGFATQPGSAPLRRADGCEWPGISERHRLAPGVAARFASGVIELWRVD